MKLFMANKRKKFAPLITASIIIGTASVANADWVATLDIDMFTDQVACEIVGADSYNELLGLGKRRHTTRTGALYPVIRLKDGELAVGVKAGGQFPIPPGDIDLRIDKNKAWRIRPAENPQDIKPEGPNISMPVFKLPNMTEEQQKAYEDSMKQTMQTISDASAGMAPYTMTTGDKAKSILAEMINGNRMIYRSSIQANLGVELSGIAQLDADFISELNECMPDIVAELTTTE